MDKQNKQIPHDQHYVQRLYLSSWTKEHSSEGNVLASLNGKPSKTYNLKRICFGKDFYQIPILSTAEYELLKVIFDALPSPHAKPYLESILRSIRLTNAIASSDLTPTDRKEFNDLLVKLGETVQRTAENMFTLEMRDRIIDCDDSFLSNDETRYRFLVYFFMQYLRTSKIKTKIIKNIDERMSKTHGINGANIWAVLHPVLADAAAKNMMMKEIRIDYLRASGSCRFWTSDNPVTRLGLSEDKTDKFYYPITPDVAIIVSTDQGSGGVKILNDEQVVSYNKLIDEGKERFLFFPPVNC